MKKIKALKEGWDNYHKDTDIPQHVLDAISKCENNIDAPISALRFEDRYIETSGKICKSCFCPQPAKTRQNISKCKCWK